MRYSLSEYIPIVIGQTEFIIIAKEEIEGREARYKAVPSELHPQIRDYLNTVYPEGLFHHQVEAIRVFLKGSDICLATATASGKSLVFIALACQILLENERRKVLAIYPARALVQDQYKKWNEFGKNFRLKVGTIDGSIPLRNRIQILQASDIILMTPDVVHAWLMNNLSSREVGDFFERLELVVLDEAHVYDGVFGTNMAYLLRRMGGIKKNFRLIVSTATLGQPAEFLYQLTGRLPRVFSTEDDSSKISPKEIYFVRPKQGEQKVIFENLVKIIRELSKLEESCFIAFTDSRVMAEQVVSAISRSGVEQEEDNNDDIDTGANEDEDKKVVPSSMGKVLPYRAGYESEDREEIQKSLEMRELTGVVSTSALELGIDIRDIDIILMLNLPPSGKAFWQRLGRAGRKRKGYCIVVDTRGILQSADDCATFLKRDLEPNWLYLHNKYLQYTNALCATKEISEWGESMYNMEIFETLPPEFKKLLDNELNPKEIIPQDLYTLKQRAQNGPHYEFPLRSGIEPNFKVVGWGDKSMGDLSHSQALREAYPGSVYYYMARPFRVNRVDYRKRQIHVRKEKRITTKPLLQITVFPRFDGGIFKLLANDKGFVAECEMQVSEKVTGYTEQRGSKQEQNYYGPGSPYSQSGLTRFFETTGVCWIFEGMPNFSEASTSVILEAFCQSFGIQERELGIGHFYSKVSPLRKEECKGACIYDATHGSLRLTQLLAENFKMVLELAEKIAHHNDDVRASSEIANLLICVNDMKETHSPQMSLSPHYDAEENKEYIEVMAPGEKAIWTSRDGRTQEIQIVDVRYTPQGIVYDVESESRLDKHTVNAKTLLTLSGITKKVRFNLSTGKIEEE